MNSPLAQSLVLPCGVELPNRIAKSAMTEGLGDADDNPTPAHGQLYRTWSEGGTGLLVTGNVMVDRRYLERAGNVVLEDDQNLPLFKRWVDEGTVAGNQLWMQINHPGRQCPLGINANPPAPSEVQLRTPGFGRPRAMTEDDIQDVIERYAHTASLAKQAGFTGVQVHAAHGYLVSQFLSPIANQRRDQWGGSLENRARFAREIVRAVRLAVGDDFPVGVKLNSADFQTGGFSLDDCVQVAAWLAQDSVDLLEVSGGTYEQLSLMGVKPKEVRESTRKREAYFIEYARTIRESASIPVAITGGFRSRHVMERAVTDGEVDIVGLARPLCTQPNASRDLIEQRVDRLDEFEQSLVLGKGFLGNNSRFKIVKGINIMGAMGFYYWQIIRMSQGLEPQRDLGTFTAFRRHISNDKRLSSRRNFRA